MPPREVHVGIKYRNEYHIMITISQFLKKRKLSIKKKHQNEVDPERSMELQNLDRLYGFD